MGNCRSRQNRVEAISDSAMRSDRGHPTENDRALKINPVSIRLRLPGSILPHEVQPDTNYHKIKLRQFASAENNADYNGAFRDTTEPIAISLEIGSPGPHRPYEVESHKNYRMWSIFSRQSDGLVQLDPAGHNVHCNGAFKDETAVITTSEINEDSVSILVKDKNKQQYVLTAQADSNDNIEIEAVKTSSDSTYPDEAQFVPYQYWGYTFFESKRYKQKYLSSESNGNMTLVAIANRDYPNPQALFILNQV
ncbi:uncharacterized protein [Porites lutea]|uniref:uncharacterized protein n=1 Tax=Porites lutea TaxID=51062 RepID=UPI003CC58FEC